MEYTHPFSPSLSLEGPSFSLAPLGHSLLLLLLACLLGGLCGIPALQLEEPKYKPLLRWPLQTQAAYACNITTEPFSLEVHGVHGGGVLTYTSSDPGVATVDASGLVTITGPGEALLTVTAGKSSGHVATSRTIPLSVDRRTGVEAAIDRLLERWPAESYFSRDGDACPHYSRSTCKNCQLQYILQSLGYDWALNEDYRDGWTCYAWARFFYRSVFGEPLDTDHATVISEGDPADPETFADTQPGDVLWLYQTGREAKPRHMAIFIGVTEEGLFLYDSNIGGSASSTGYIRYGTAAWERVDANWSTCQVLHANNYDEIAIW